MGELPTPAYLAKRSRDGEISTDAFFGTRNLAGKCLFWKTGSWEPCEAREEWIAALQGTTRLEQALLEDPGFVNREGNDFRLSEGSPCGQGGREGGALGAAHAAAHATRSKLVVYDD